MPRRRAPSRGRRPRPGPSPSGLDGRRAPGRSATTGAAARGRAAPAAPARRRSPGSSRGRSGSRSTASTGPARRRGPWPWARGARGPSARASAGPRTERRWRPRRRPPPSSHRACRPREARRPAWDRGGGDRLGVADDRLGGLVGTLVVPASPPSRSRIIACAQRSPGPLTTAPPANEAATSMTAKSALRNGAASLPSSGPAPAGRDRRPDPGASPRVRPPRRIPSGKSAGHLTRVGRIPQGQVGGPGRPPFPIGVPTDTTIG